MGVLTALTSAFGAAIDKLTDTLEKRSASLGWLKPTAGGTKGACLRVCLCVCACV